MKYIYKPLYIIRLSEWIMYNDNKKYTKLTLEKNDLKIEYELPYDDVDGNYMLQAFKTIMIGMTFSEDAILSAFASYINEHGYDKYEVRDITD